MKKDLCKDLENLVGEEHVFCSTEEKICYSYDATNKSFPPDAVVIPKDVDQIVKVVKYAAENQIPIIPRGTGSGYTGGTLPVKGGIVLSLEQMNKVIIIDQEKKYAIVEPGVLTYDFATQVSKLGLLYPPDPSSLKYSSLGGNVAECAGGLKGKKYGVTKNYVIGLEAVFADGQIIRTGILGDGDGSGYDIEGLLIGSEGTLGIITKIALRLVPQPLYSEAILATFPDMESAARVVAEITASGIIPSVMEYIDEDSLECVLNYINLDFIERGAGAVLLIESEGEKEEAHAEIEEIKKICQEERALNLHTAVDPNEIEKLWKVRRSVSASLLRIAPTKVNEDICVPPSRLPEMVKGIKELAKKFDVQINTFGHAGDGNLHVNIMCDSRNQEEMERVHKAVDELFDLTLKLDGTLSGEHGIGTTKAKYLENEVGKEGVELMKKIKSAFDPQGIINPGKIFAS